MRLDETIKEDIVNQIVWDSRIDASKVEITVNNGHVTLKGSVPTYNAKAAAEDDAWLVRGVNSVTNLMKIKYPATFTFPSDEEIRANIESVILWNPDLPSADINVRAERGRVTLEGTVDTFWHKMQAEDEAWSVRGVIGVTNKLAVVPTTKVSDEIIGQEVVKAIDRNYSIEVDDVTVTVNNGEVKLVGTVPDWTAKAAAYRSALFTLGVTDVDNHLVIEQPA